MTKHLIQPKNWDELVKLSDFISSCDASELRFPEDKLYYETYRKVIPREYLLQLLLELIGDQEYKLLKNNFPYTKILAFLPEVQHYCIWNKKRAMSEVEIKEIVEERFPSEKWFYVESVQNRKSIPEIWHAHVFIHSIRNN